LPDSGSPLDRRQKSIHPSDVIYFTMKQFLALKVGQYV
jgi:hypothetical protein